MNLVKSALLAILGLAVATVSIAAERVVATVNGDPVLESQVQSALGKKANNEANRRAATDQVIDNILVQQAIKNSGVKITAAQVERAIENIAAQNGITYGQLLDAIEYQGMNINQYRQQIAHQMLMAAVQQQNFGKNVDVTREQVESLGNQMFNQAKESGKLQEVTATEYNVRHILLKTNPLLNDNKAKAELSKIRSDIISGKITFADAAKNYSKDYLSGANGGSLGYALPNAYVGAFQNTIVKTKKGVISQPFKTEFGWHILEVVDTRQSDVTKDVYLQKAYEQIVNKQLQEESRDWVKGLRRGADIQYLNN
ncbi:periplasmic chaperone for outer membrane proteins SurA [Cricetibacter osteomyelitidis]|uniref:Periplasmic chaperone for outer membrane proteins SurA n=2 Tax=Cricetibacter osteomyelitidis TaxID=1521931 RepID=A0A4R2TK54_9PAST|nr:periplasmic chaperone for outer membrane proteins SurA [Cricetibacter osteomyelitidis]